MSQQPDIQRASKELTSITIDASAASDSTSIDYAAWSGGTIYVPSGSTITSLTWYALDPQDGITWQASYDNASTPAAVTQIVAAGQSYPIPDELYGATKIAAVGDAAGTISATLKG